MKATLRNKIIIIFTLVCLACSPAVTGYACGDGGGAPQLIVNTILILTTVVFAIWNADFIAAFLSHTGLGTLLYKNAFVAPLMIIPMLLTLGMMADRPLTAVIAMKSILAMSVLVSMMSYNPRFAVMLASSAGLLGLAPFSKASFLENPAALLTLSFINLTVIASLFQMATGNNVVLNSLLATGQAKGMTNLVKSQY